MSRKTFFLQVELDIQAVTCPGVWLCANGDVSLQIYFLESCVQTTCHKPSFPIQLNQKFLFYKTFSTNNHRLNALNKALNHDYIYIELIQWRSCETGTVLATFQTTLNELLYPTTKSGSIPGIDIDLLMEPTKCFPGRIAPIIQLITKTTIDEKICICDSSNLNTINPKIVSSKCGDKSIKHQPRKVCHSIGYSRRKFPLKTIKKPPFRYRKPDDYLILRKPQYDSTIPNNQQQQQQHHGCRERHVGNVVKVTNYQNNCCAICSKYHGYFKLPISNKNKCKTGDMLTNRKCCDCRPLQSNDTSKGICCCNDDRDDDDDDDNTEKLSNLSEQLHKKLNDALETLTEPDCQCSSREEPESSAATTMPDCNEKCRAKFYLDLHKFYGDLYEQTQSTL